MEQQFLTDSAIEWRLLFEISEKEDKAREVYPEI